MLSITPFMTRSTRFSDLAVTYSKIARENDRVAEQDRRNQERDEMSTVETEPAPDSAWHGGARGSGEAGAPGGTTQAGLPNLSPGTLKRRASQSDLIKQVKNM